MPFVFEIITLWKKLVKEQEVSGEVKVELTDPSGNIIQEIKHPIVIKKEHKRLRNRIQIRGFKITDPGEYAYLIYFKEDDKKFNLVGKTPFIVNIIKSRDIQNIKSIS